MHKRLWCFTKRVFIVAGAILISVVGVMVFVMFVVPIIWPNGATIIIGSPEGMAQSVTYQSSSISYVPLIGVLAVLGLLVALWLSCVSNEKG